MGLLLGIRDWDMVLGFGNGIMDWDWGLVIRIGDWEFGSGLGIGDLDWGL